MDILERKTTLSKSAGTQELRIVPPEKAKNRKRNRAKGAGPPEEEVVWLTLHISQCLVDDHFAKAARLMKTLRQQQGEGLVDDESGESDSDND